MSLSITTEVADDVVTVAVDGEVDVSNADELSQALDAVMAQAPKTVQVDMAKVPYIDSTGIGVLVGCAHRLGDGDGELVVSHAQPNVLRVLTLLGVGSEFHVED